MSENEKDGESLGNTGRGKARTVLSRSLGTGFTGGIICGILGVFLYFFNFTEVAPKSFLLRSWLKTDWTDGWLGAAVSVILIGLLSIIAALVYYGVFKKVNSMWMGAGYGVVIWWIVFYVLQPIFPGIPSLMELDKNTIVSTICLYVLYGTFIGYSIAYDYHDTMLKEQIERENS